MSRGGGRAPDPKLVARVKAARSYMTAKAIAYILKVHQNTVTNYLSAPGSPDVEFGAKLERLFTE
jgi:Fic family protein